MTNTYSTGNPIGSSDPRDAYDNKSNFDEFALSANRFYADRLGADRKTITGALQDYAAYNPRGDWSTATAYNTNDIWKDPATGDFYFVPADYTSGASVAADIAAGNVVPHQIKNTVFAIDTIAELRSLEPLFDGQQIELLGHTTAGIGGGIFYADYSDTTSPDDDETVVVTPLGRRWKAKNAISQITVTVGSGGQFSNINDAIRDVSRRYHTHSSTNNPYRVTINLLSGFVMSEQLIVDAINLSWITITSDDAIVTIQRSSLTNTYPNLDFSSTPAFLAVNGGCLPNIGALFSMDTSGAADSAKQHGVMVAWRGGVTVLPDCGVTNATGRGLYGVNGIAYARNSNFSGAGTYCCRPGNSSVFNVRGSNFSGAGDTALYTAASIVSASDADCSGAAVDAIQAINGSYVNCPRADLTNAGRYAVWARGGIIEGDDVDITGFATRGIQADNGIFIGESVVCDNPVGPIAVSTRGASITLANFSPTNVSINNTLQAFSSGEIKAPFISITGPSAGNSQLFVGNGGYIVASGTTLSSNVTPNVQTGSGLIVNDIVVSNSGVATVAGGNSTTTVNHGLGVTPTTSDIVVNPVNNEAAGSAWRVGSADATSFVIALNSAASSDANFAWKVSI